MCLSWLHKTCINQKLTQHCIIQGFISRGLQMMKMHSESESPWDILPALPGRKSSAAIPSLWLYLGRHWPLAASCTQIWSGLLGLGFVMAQLSDVILLLIVSDYYRSWLIVTDWDWICINRSWVNSIVVCWLTVIPWCRHYLYSWSLYRWPSTFGP